METSVISAARWLLAATGLALLSACLSPQGTPGSAARGGPAAPAASAPSAAHTVTLAGSVEKHQLSISYSIATIHGTPEDLLRVTLLFRNLDDQAKPIRPRVALIDAAGDPLRAYSASEFRRVVSRAGKAQAAQLANVSWLKTAYRIPPGGIVLGELVYHAKEFRFPLKLTVTERGDRFEFTAEEP